MPRGQSSIGNRDSAGKRLGIKCSGGQQVTAGSIIIRQRGNKFYPGKNVGIGSDYTLYSKIDGQVKFEWKCKGQKKVSVYPVEVAS